MSRIRLLVFIVFLLGFVSTALAQDDCPAIVKAALSAVDGTCANTGRNQACYGNIQLSATPRDGATLAFDKAGDIANVADLKTLQLSSMSLADDSWGIALMQLQASLPDTLPGQNVTFLLFGNVRIEDTGGIPVELTMTAQRSVNVRLRPTTTANNVIGSLKPGQEVTANGRLQDGSWLRIKTEDGTGWVAAAFLKTDDDVNSLNAVEAGAPVFGPMQAFSFSTGIDDRPCAEAPDSGILIQTPKGGQRVTFNVDGVTVDVGSTVYLQAQPSDVLMVTVLEGAVKLTANGTSQGVPAGTFSHVPLDANGRASGTPTYPQPYDRDKLLTLPLNVGLPQRIGVRPPLPTAQVEPAVETVTAIASGLPPSGNWGGTVVETRSNCPGDPANKTIGYSSYWYFSFTFSEDWQILTYDNDFSGFIFNLHRSSDNLYSEIYDSGYNNSITVTVSFPTPTTFIWSRDYYNSGGNCGLRYDGSGTFLG